DRPASEYKTRSAEDKLEISGRERRPSTVDCRLSRVRRRLLLPPVAPGAGVGLDPVLRGLLPADVPAGLGGEEVLVALDLLQLGVEVPERLLAPPGLREPGLPAVDGVLDGRLTLVLDAEEVPMDQDRPLLGWGILAQLRREIHGGLAAQRTKGILS